jgi:hypothetical protein
MARMPMAAAKISRRNFITPARNRAIAHSNLIGHLTSLRPQ